MVGGAGRSLKGAKRGPAGPPLFIALLLLASFSGQANGIDCTGQFTPAEDTTLGGNRLIYNRNVNELEAVSTSLLDLSWSDGVFGTPNLVAGADTDLATQYLGVALDSTTLGITVDATMEGLPDYPDSKESLVLEYTFPVTEDASECTVRMVFKLVDQNTQAPVVDQASYTATVREDFPALYTIPNLQVLAHDTDGAAPNNVLIVSFDAECPLTSSRDTYDADGGEDLPITFQLTKQLDYDTMDDPAVTCSVSVSDQGTDPGPLEATLTILITVESVSDEDPEFQSPIYNTVLEAVEAPTGPLTVLPAPGLQATDADKPPEVLTYSMTVVDGEDGAWAGYFSLDGATGDVTQTQDIDPDLLEDNYSVHFIVTVEDAGGAQGTTVLEIILPPAPTTSTTSTTTTTPTTTTSTTTTSTTTTTTETPTTTTSTTTETPTTTTSTTTEAASTTTCTPCETTPTTETTWTTPLQTTTITPTTSTESTTISPPPTTTINPVNTEQPTTCEPCTTEVVTCPTLESTTSTTEGGSPTSTLEITPSSLSPTDSPVSSSESSTSQSTSTQSTDSLESSPSTNPTSTETGGTTASDLTTSPTSVTCEPCECSTTSTGSTVDTTTTTVDPSAPTTTVDPSATTTTTVAPTASTTTVPPTTTTTPATTTSTTEEPAGPQYKFEYQAYHFQPFTTSVVVGRVRVVQADGSPLGSEVIKSYAWAADSAPGSDGFTLDQTNGEISMNGAGEAYYTLVAEAIIDGGEPLPVEVYITVVEPPRCNDDLFIPVGLITVSVPETASDVTITTITTETGGEDKFCVTDVQPEQYRDYFTVDTSGELKLVTAIDADPDGGQLVTVRVEAQEEDGVCPKTASSDLYRNEVLVQVMVEDENDQAPSLVMPSPGDTVTRLGYPTNRGLQQVVGAVTTLKAEDGDTKGSLEFTISDNPDNLFMVQTDEDANTGALYLLDYEACGEQCDVTVTVTDGLNEAQGHKIEVHSLELSHIYDITLEDMDSEDIEEYVNKLSEDSGLDLHLLYSSLDEPSSARRAQRTNMAALKDDFRFHSKRGLMIQGGDSNEGEVRTFLKGDPRTRKIHRRDFAVADFSEKDDGSKLKEDSPSWNSMAHIYGFTTDGSLVTLDVLNSALESQDIQATEFTEKAAFEPTVEEVSLSGWKAAVGVLGGLLGLMLVAAIVVFVVYRKRQKKTPPTNPSSHRAVSTIGSAYPNHGYEDTEMNKLDSTSTSSEDSTYKSNGFKKALGTTSTTTTNNNLTNNNKPNSGQTPIANPFTSIPVNDSPIYETPNMSSAPPRDTLLLTSSTPAPNAPTMGREAPSYGAPAERKSVTPVYENDEDYRGDGGAGPPGGLRRITPGPLPDGAKSSPYLSKSEGDYETFRPSDTERVASFTPYKGGEGKGSESPPAPQKSSPPPSAASFKPAYKPEAFSYLDDVPRREVLDAPDKKDKTNDTLGKQTKLDTSPYAFPVRAKKEPPNLSVAAPAKTSMKTSKDSGLVSTSADVHRSADEASSSSGGGKGSPPTKAKDGRERKSSLKVYSSEGEMSDSELKKSVAFKVLVDEKHIKRNKEKKEDEEKEEKAEKAEKAEKEEKAEKKKEEEVEKEETEDL